MTFLGVLLILAGIVLLFINIFAVRESSEEDKWGDKKDKWPNALLKISKTHAYTVMSIGLALIILNSFLFYSRGGHKYWVIAPNGSEYAITTSGYKLVIPFSRVQEWQDFIDVKAVSEGEPVEGIEGVIKDGVNIRFIDQVSARVKISARFELPRDPEAFIKLAREFRHPLNLVNNTLIPTVKEQTINTGYMFAAQDYISGAASDFKAALEEQLKDGGFSVERKEFYDTAYIEAISQTEGQRRIKDIRTRYEVTKRLIDGVPVRIPHDITKNNITVSQVIVDEVNLEEAFKKRLEKQRDISAEKRIELEKIETAKAAQQRIIAEGERDKASERATQEKEQVKKLIAIETRLKEEETNKKLAAIQYETEVLKSKAVKVSADAESYKNQRLVTAGLTPQERAEWDYKTAVGVAEKIAGPTGIKFPSTYVSGSQANGGEKSNDILTLILLETMKKGNTQ